eukprot:4788034-Alexandrium_andersonii.AAC.1
MDHVLFRDFDGDRQLQALCALRVDDLLRAYSVDFDQEGSSRRSTSAVKRPSETIVYYGKEVR